MHERKIYSLLFSYITVSNSQEALWAFVGILQNNLVKELNYRFKVAADS